VPTKVKASDGDSLCGLAIAAGFLDCKPLRALAENQPFLNRPLKVGDEVTIPDRELNILQKAVNSLHLFKKKNSPPVSIRFVHGSADKKYLEDFTLFNLNVSNYETDKAGTNGRRPFPSQFEFQADGDADLDTFKVEVVDPAAGGSVKVKFEALKPIYKADLKVERHESFTDGEPARKLEVVCQKVKSGVAYRSKYLRLVTDDEDANTKPNQTIMVTDMADGLGTGKPGDNDTVEILDQQVRACYEYSKCPASPKCAVTAQLPIGGDRLRIRLAFHVFRDTPGGAAVGGTTEKFLRRRTFKWFRRAYAQANMAPKLVDPVVEFVDPPPANMLVISQDHGRLSSGNTSSGGASSLAFVLSTPPPKPAGAPRDPVVNISLAPGGQTPKQVGDAIVTALPDGFEGEAFENARATNAANGSCDVLITRTDGQRVMIRSEVTNDTRLTVTVARVDINNVNSVDTPATMIPTTVEFRRVIRAAPGADDRLDCYVVGRFTNFGLRGRAFVPARDLAASFQPPAPLRFAAMMATSSSNGPVMDGGDNLPFTFPHEAGHVLNDAFHTDSGDPNGPTQLMSGTGTSVANAVAATKRICDAPVLVRYGAFDPAQPSPGAAKLIRINAVERFRQNAASLTEAW
jgi:hypothetical protein